jgi:hypothetical protein
VWVQGLAAESSSAVDSGLIDHADGTVAVAQHVFVDAQIGDDANEKAGQYKILYGQLKGPQSENTRTLAEVAQPCDSWREKDHFSSADEEKRSAAGIERNE